MRGYLLLVFLVPLTAQARVVDLQKHPVQQVLNVYEEQEQAKAPHQGWIHAFEEESLGPEMDHLAKLKADKDKITVAAE